MRVCVQYFIEESSVSQSPWLVVSRSSINILLSFTGCLWKLSVCILCKHSEQTYELWGITGSRCCSWKWNSLYCGYAVATIHQECRRKNHSRAQSLSSSHGSRSNKSAHRKCHRLTEVLRPSPLTALPPVTALRGRPVSITFLAPASDWKCTWRICTLACVLRLWCGKIETLISYGDATTASPLSSMKKADDKLAYSSLSIWGLIKYSDITFSKHWKDVTLQDSDKFKRRMRSWLLCEKCLNTGRQACGPLDMI